MRGLKALVVVMGVLIIVGVSVVAITIARRSGIDAEPETVATRPFDDVSVALPKGARLIDWTADGGRLVLRVRAADGGERLMIFDLASGRRLGTVHLAEEPAGTR